MCAKKAAQPHTCCAILNSLHNYKGKLIGMALVIIIMNTMVVEEGEEDTVAAEQG